MDQNILMLFVGSVFVTVFLLSQVLILPNFGTTKEQRKKLKHRFDNLLLDRRDTHQQLVKTQYLDQLNPVARWVESLPFLTKLKLLLEQAGFKIPAYRFILIVVILNVVIGYILWNKFHLPVLTLLILAFGLVSPFYWIQKKRKNNLERFDELLPETLEMMARSLQSGFPFNECLRIVSEEMPDPIGLEFGILFDELNYGRNLEMAMALMIERIPSLSLNAMATSVLIQRDTGGNMSEILLKISEVLRGRFKLQRKVKTLAAEGIFSAWVLCLTPFIMFFVLTAMNEDHFKVVFDHPDGMNLFYAIGILEIVAIIWMSNIVNIDV